LQSLVDDDLVHQEKIGISNYFWSFPSEAAVKLNTEAGKLGDRLKARKAEEKKLREDLVKSQVGKQNTVKFSILFWFAYWFMFPFYAIYYWG